MRATATIICILAAAGLATYAGLERRASLQLERENNGLRQRLSQMDNLRAENQRLSALATEANGSASRPNLAAHVSPAMDGPAKELVRLRGEVEALSQQSREIETLRANTREARAAAGTARQAKSMNNAANSQSATDANESRFELLRADYWTDKTNLDVAAELREKIRGDKLKAMASNNLKGDPDFGEVKHLTVVYRFGGVTITNEFREGDFVVLPKEPEQ
jgi:type II secretory pathway pseudopilin PulG